MSGPFRNATPPASIPQRCLFCGGSVLEHGGGYRCSRCALPAALHEPIAATPTCPRCSTPFARRALEPRAANDATVYVCTGCQGCFVQSPDWDGLVLGARARLAGPAEGGPLAARSGTFATVRCPACPREMERATFGARSNVVIDVCPPHGVWFDAGELAQALALAESGVPPEPGGMDRWVARQEELLRQEASIVAAARASEDPRDRERFGHSAAREEEARAMRVENVIWISRLVAAQPRKPGE